MRITASLIGTSANKGQNDFSSSRRLLLLSKSKQKSPRSWLLRQRLFRNMAMFAGVLNSETLYGGHSFYHIGDGLHFNVSQVSEDQKTAAFSCMVQGCPGSAVWHQESGFRHTFPHNHLPRPLYVQEIVLKRRILTRINNEDSASYAEILQEESSWFSAAVQARVSGPKFLMEMKLRRLHLYPFNPTSLQDVGRILHDPHYKVMSMTNDGRDNLFSNYFRSPDGIGCLVLGSQRMISFLSRASQIFCDCSRVTPTVPAWNVLSITAVFNNFIVPILFCISERKTFLVYQSILMYIKRLNPQFSPECVIVGFDDNLVAAFNSQYPGTMCLNKTLYHFIHGIMEAVKELQLNPLIKVDLDARKAVESCCSINLFPHANMQAAFMHIVNDARLSNVYHQLRPLYNYVWTTWLSGERYEMEGVSVSESEECTMNTFDVLGHLILTKTISRNGNLFNFLGTLAGVEEVSFEGNSDGYHFYKVDTYNLKHEIIE